MVVAVAVAVGKLSLAILKLSVYTRTMANEILNPGHVEFMKQRYNFSLEDNSETGVLNAVKENASAIFHALDQELGNVQIEPRLEMTEMFVDGGKKDKALEYLQILTTMISTAEDLVRISEAAIKTAGDGSSQQQNLENRVAHYKTGLPSWKEKLRQLTAKAQSI